MFSARSFSAVARAGARTYAVTAPKAAAVKVPVALFGVDGTYASALYTASAKTQSLEATDKALKVLQGVLAKDPKLVTILSSPILQGDAKNLVVAEVTKAAGSDKTIKNLLEVLADNNRLGLVGGIIEKYDILMSAQRGEVEAVITSAVQLDPRTISKLESVISKSQYIGTGKKLRTVNKVDPTILGGLVVEVGDRTIDLSISAKITKLNKLLTDAL